MLRVDLESNRQRERWERLGGGDIGDAQKDAGADLLEVILEEGGFNRDLLDLLARIRMAMVRFWPDPGISVPLIARKDITHNRRILFYIASILFPHAGEMVEPGAKRVPCIYPSLDQEDLFVLLCAVYLHDYGKGQFLLVLPELPETSTDRDAFESAVTPGNLTDLQHALLERYHSKSITSFLDCFLQLSDRSKLQKEIQRLYGPRLDSFSGTIGTKLEPISSSEDYNANLAQQHLFDALWHLAVPESKRLLQQIQMISGAHKPYQLDGEKEVDTFDDLGERAANYRQLPLLAALLRIADNLDMTRERLAPSGALPGGYEQWVEEGAPDNIAEDLQIIYTKWLTFEVVRGVRIDHREGQRDGKRQVACKPVIVEITLQYEKIEGWREHLSTLRKLAEKDFRATNYLEELCRGEPDCEVDLRLLYELVAPAASGDRPEDVRRICGALHDRLLARRVEPQVEAGRDYQTILAEEGFRFSPLAPLAKGIELPTHLDLLYLIGYLKSFGRSSCADISTKLALGFAARLRGEARLVAAGKLLRIDEEGFVDFFDDKARERCVKLLRVFRQRPSLVREKIRELAEWGETLPFSLSETDTVPTGIDGLDKILTPLKQSSEEDRGFQHSRTLLVVGGPGTGKTTLLVQILLWNSHRTQHRVLMLTFEELPDELSKNYSRHYGWELDFIHGIQLGPTFETTLARIHQIIDGAKETPDLIAIDGLSRLRGHRDMEHHEQVDILLKSLVIRGIRCIASLEEPLIEKAVEQYQADGVIHLFQNGASRQIEIEKLRSQDPVAGRHAFEILDQVHLDIELQQGSVLVPGVNVYPNELYYASVTETSSSNQGSPIEYLRTGMEQLDRLLPGRRKDEQGYRRGETILVLGSPGAGKTLFGLHFLKADLDVSEGSMARALWLSFEGPKSVLERSVASFDDGAGFRRLLGKEGFVFRFVPFALISPEKVLYYVTEMVKAKKIEKLVVDSVSEIDEAFKDKVRFRQYMTTFIHALIPSGVTTMFLYRVPGFFRSARESDSAIATLVDTIISIKTFDMKNQIRRGLFVLKSRSRELRSQLQTLDIDARSGIKVSNKGWEMEGLLSGETGSIHEPEVFLKHFYENPAESDINREMILQFRERYPLKGRFTEVRKPAVYSEFWSFRGNYGAGHSNIRVASISRYMVEAFRERDTLHDLDEFFPADMKEKIAGDVRWRRYETQHKGHDSIPLYTDIGVLLVRKDLARRLLASLEEGGSPGPGAGNREQTRAVSWDDLKALALEVAAAWPRDSGHGPEGGEAPRTENAKDPAARLRGWGLASETAAARPQDGGAPEAAGARPWDGGASEAAGAAPAWPRDIPFVFALPDLHNRPEFMACFFEILWTKGGDIFHFPVFDGEPAGRRDTFYKDHIFLNKHLWKELMRIIKPSSPGAAAFSPPEDVKKRIEPLLGTLERLAATVNLQRPPSADPIQRLTALIEQLIVKNPKLTVDDGDVLTINNQLGIDALEFLYGLVFDTGGAVPNPYYGDGRYNAVFSRRWYSQVQGVPEEVKTRRGEEAGRGRVGGGAPPSTRARARSAAAASQVSSPKGAAQGTGDAKPAVATDTRPAVTDEDLDLRPLPYFSLEVQGKTLRRSCTCESVWCLCLVKEALSPEIGWIYIDSLTSREWVERRAALRCGLPYQVDEMTTMERHDPEVYLMLREIVETKLEKDKIYDAESRLVARYDGKSEAEIGTEVDKAVKDFFHGEYHHRDVRDVLAAFDRNPDLAALDLRRRLFEEKMRSIEGESAVEACKSDRRLVSETPNFEGFEGRIPLRSRLPDHRPLFHRVESILHEEIVTLFSPQGREGWSKQLQGTSPPAGERVDDVLRKEREKLITRALSRMHDRLIFDLLTGYPGELEKRWPGLATPAP